MGKLSAPRLVYTAVRVRNLKRSIDFYTKALGMRLQFKFKIKETGGYVAYLKSPGGKQLLELNWYPEGRYRKGDELDHLAFKVPDLQAVHLTLTAQGAKVTMGTFREGSTLLTFYEDPDGIPLEIASSLKGRYRVKKVERARAR
jgi:catechol 2,3-dioxygenase-like lactoylglutathione lyase family enzyme